MGHIARSLRHLMLRGQLLALLTCSALSACVIVPTPVINDFSDQQLALLQPNITTRGELNKLLGKPEATINGGRYLVYDKDWASLGYLGTLLLPGASPHWKPDTEKTYRIAVQLNQGVLSNIWIARVDINEKEKWYKKETAPLGMRTDRRIAILTSPKIPVPAIIDTGQTETPRYGTATVSPDGSRLAVIPLYSSYILYGDRIPPFLDVYDLKNLAFLRRLNVTKDANEFTYFLLNKAMSPVAMVFLNDNHTLLGMSVPSNDALLWSLDTSTGDYPKNIGRIPTACWSSCYVNGQLVSNPNGITYYATFDGPLWKLQTANRELQAVKLSNKTGIKRIGLSPNGDLLILGKGMGEVALLDPRNGSSRLFDETRTNHSAENFAFYMSKTATHLLILRDAFVEVWRLGQTLDERAEFEHVLVLPKYPEMAPLTYPGQMAISQDGRYVAVGSGRALTLWDLENGSEIWRYIGDKEKVTDLAFINHGCQFVSIAENGITVWDVSDLKPLGQCRRQPSAKNLGTSNTIEGKDQKTLEGTGQNYKPKNAFVVAVDTWSKRNILVPKAKVKRTIIFTNVQDARRQKYQIGERSAAFGVSMGDVYFYRSVPAFVEDMVATELRAAGHSVLKSGVGTPLSIVIKRFSATTEPTLLYWDVVANVELSVVFGDLTKSFSCQKSDRTYIWPTEYLFSVVVDDCLIDLMKKVRDDPIWQRPQPAS